MRIGIFTETYKPYISGLVTSVAMLKGALEKQGHEVYVVTANLETFKYEYNPDMSKKFDNLVDFINAAR